MYDAKALFARLNGHSARISVSTGDGPNIPKTVAELLAEFPPGNGGRFSNAFCGSAAADLPALRILCPNEGCGGERVFRATQGIAGAGGDSQLVRLVLSYKCQSCETEQKLYLLLSQPNYVDNHDAIEIKKIGEWPPFGSWVPPRVLKIVGPDRDLFLRGKRCESQGLGIGAFGYYRRVVERQKGRLIEQIRAVAVRTGAAPEVQGRLLAAQNETQFTKAVELAKNAIPEQVLIKGHNPLTLLHDALSKGIHSDSDEKCLELAHDVRVVLTELVFRIDQALAGQSELNDALSRLLNSRENTK